MLAGTWLNDGKASCDFISFSRHVHVVLHVPATVIECSSLTVRNIRVPGCQLDDARICYF
jgi:hypothetical protein